MLTVYELLVDENSNSCYYESKKHSDLIICCINDNDVNTLKASPENKCHFNFYNLK